ncbi:hypothetical protein SAMN05421767_10417 [Granulicatella balaenopterae]|uniref:Uncharacterized protein n=1 Tax=Granulicatella balaenopterae TaxID=137733 RepID=A0A1H9I0K6_9LACT|nr:hypothetical protein [Granulicatella balaenopterae]SEQ68121.1 hypothetical protein SAMN05421767_10417 [Granulicatella balaenopterae]
MSNVIYIRGIAKSKKEKLKELARLNGFKSLNQYLKYVLSELAEEKEVKEYQRIHIKHEQILVDALERNTEIITDIVTMVGGEDDE